LEVETDIKYAGYIERQRLLIAQTEKLDGFKLPVDFNYLASDHLSKEAREKLNKIRPMTLGQASRIGGVSPADISVLMVLLEQQRRADNARDKAGVSV
jgi:tRNA uridine 5-carboxymethylaminomethyl modification enzyme